MLLRDAVPGDYAGTISLLHEEDVLVSVPLWVHVWDFGHRHHPDMTFIR